MKLFRQVLSWTLAATLGGIGFLAHHLGTLMNFIFLLLMLLAPINLLWFGWRILRKELYHGLFTRPLAPESRKYWWPCLARVVFYLCCGYLLHIGIVPYQFPEMSPVVFPILGWILVLLQLVLALLPASRISIAFTSLFTVGAAFMLWQFVQISLPTGGEPVLLNSPLQGVSCVVQGGNSSIVNHHYGLRSQRYAVDLFKVAETEEQVRQWKLLEGDVSFGQTIYSPCDGRIAYIEDLHPDNESGKAVEEHPAGNYLTIEIATDRYVMIAHLKEKSLLVRPGDIVSSGQSIAQCGNSGNSSGPHVHLQVQTTPQFTYEGQTVPMTFRDVLRGKTHVENIQPKRNDLLLLPSE